MSYSEQDKQQARAFVAARRAATVCAHCGKQPIDWHREGHLRNDRPGAMAARGVPIPRIEAEIARCTPLCRRCHMRLDGRTKVTDEEVALIAVSTGRARDVAALYGISRKHVEAIRRLGRRY